MLQTLLILFYSFQTYFGIYRAAIRLDVFIKLSPKDKSSEMTFFFFYKMNT